MRHDTTLAKANALHPAACAEAIAALRASSSKSKNDPTSALAFQWELAVGIDPSSFGDLSSLFTPGKAAKPKKPFFADVPESLRATDPQSYCDQKIASGQFSIFLICNKRYASARLAPGSTCPSEIVDAYRVAPVAALVAGASVIHISCPGAIVPGIHQHEITGGYTKDGVAILMDSEGILHQLDPANGRALFAGALHGTAQSAYDACAPGSTFRYRNKAMSRMTQAQIDAEIAKAPVWSMGMAGLGSPYGPAAPTLTGLEPVYPPGAMSHPSPAAIGTAASLGLCPAAPAPAAKAKKSKP